MNSSSSSCEPSPPNAELLHAADARDLRGDAADVDAECAAGRCELARPSSSTPAWTRKRLAETQVWPAVRQRSGIHADMATVRTSRDCHLGTDDRSCGPHVTRSRGLRCRNRTWERFPGLRIGARTALPLPRHGLTVLSPAESACAREVFVDRQCRRCAARKPAGARIHAVSCEPVDHLRRLGGCANAACLV